MAAAESADPFEGEAPASGKTRLTHGGPNPAHLTHQEGQHYDQLKQEDEILSGGDHK